MQLQGSEILTFPHSYQFNYSYHGSKVLVLGKGQQEICKTGFNFDAAHMQNKKKNKKHTYTLTKNPLAEFMIQPFVAVSLQPHRDGFAKNVPVFVAPSEINWSKAAVFKSSSNNNILYFQQIEELAGFEASHECRAPGESASVIDCNLTKTFLLFLHELT